MRAAYLVCLDATAAEDIAQEALVAAVRSLGRFDRRRPFAPWLRRIVVNRAIDWTRMRAARPEVVSETMLEMAADAGPGEGAGAGLGLGLGLGDHDELVAALAALTPAHRAVVVMRYVLDLSPAEIARALGIPRGTVNARLRRGLDTLGHLLERDGEPVP